MKLAGNSKQMMTVMAACMADGTRLPPMFIIASKSPFPLNVKTCLPADCILGASESGWINGKVSFGCSAF